MNSVDSALHFYYAEAVQVGYALRKKKKRAVANNCFHVPLDFCLDSKTREEYKCETTETQAQSNSFCPIIGPCPTLWTFDPSRFCMIGLFYFHVT